MPADAPTADHPPDAADLTHERIHLTDSRAALHRMRERVSRLEAHGGNKVSTEYLKAALYHRMRALEDDPEIPLFFGRLDYTGPPERFYIGRRHVTDEIGDPMVIDWRAPISRPFYRASKTEPLGVGLRRRFGFSHGTMTAYEDEHLDVGEEQQKSEILESEIERPRVGPMRDIVATIQPDQDDIVRADLSTSLCVQGAPGTGKTAVGLHRAAFLLYTFRDQVSRQGVLVVGPNDSFLRYIADVLPALGEIDAKQRTVEALTASVRLRAADDGSTGRLKGDARMATVIRRAVWGHLVEPAEGLVVPRGSWRWRVPAYEIEEIVAGLKARDVRYGAARAMLAQRLAHAILVKMEIAGDSPDDRVQDSVARSKPVRACVDAVWPKVEPAKVVFRLLSDAAFLAAAARDVLDADEQARLAWNAAPRSAGAAQWTLADAVLIDEAADVIDRTPSVAHVVLDEAQDLSPMMLRAVGRRCSTGSVTVLGDLAQATTPWGASSWPEVLVHLGKPDTHVEELTQGFRVPASVLEYATRLLPLIAPTLEPPTAVRRARGDLVVSAVARPLTAAADALPALLDGEGSVGVIVPDELAAAAMKSLADKGVAATMLGSDDDADARVDVVPASLAKGLEFDHVVLIEPAQVVAADSDPATGLRRLYVCLTRAVTSLLVLHAEPLPEALGEPT